MVAVDTKDERLATFVEQAKEKHKKDLEEISELQRLLEQIGREVEAPQIYRISVRSNW